MVAADAVQIHQAVWSQAALCVEKSSQIHPAVVTGVPVCMLSRQPVRCAESTRRWSQAFLCVCEQGSLCGVSLSFCLFVAEPQVLWLEGV